MGQQPLLRFVEFVKKHIGSNHLTIAEYFNEEISEMASECRVNWNETKNNLNYNGQKDNSKAIVNLEKADARRTYVSGLKKRFEKDGDSFEYPILVFACMQNTYQRPSRKFNPLGLLFDAYDKYKTNRTIPTPKRKVSSEELKVREAENALKQANYAKWVAQEQAREIEQFPKMRALTAPKTFSLYLNRKQVGDVAKAFDIRIGLDNHGYFTCFPLYNLDGELGGFQRIYNEKPEGCDTNKKQTIDKDLTGYFFALGPLNDETEMVYICEGLATALSMHAATGRTVIVCLYAHNIEPVSGALANVLPMVKRVHVADNDNQTHHCGNTGVYKCAVAVQLHGGHVFVPKPSTGTDANDVHVNEGLDALKAQIYDTDNYFNGRFSKDVAGPFNTFN